MNNSKKHLQLEDYTTKTEPVDDDIALYKPFAQKVRDLRLSSGVFYIGDVSLDDSDSDDSYNSAKLLTVANSSVTTYRYCAFLGNKDARLTVRSRFAPDNDWFVMYMLSRTMNVDVSSLTTHSHDAVELLDILQLLLPAMLQRAVANGWYKEYQCRHYNNSRVRGTIDVSRHIRLNTPFNGNIAYSVREHSFDNRISQLIRHTVELAISGQFGQNALLGNAEMRKLIKCLRSITPSYSRGQRQRVILEGQRPIANPLYHDYERLRQLCLRILRHDKSAYAIDDGSDEIYGIIIDMPYLWEEYLATILRNHEHPSNRYGSGTRYLDTEKQLDRYPDFITDGKIVIDAKYKRHDKVNRNRNDIAQIISYMRCFRADTGVIVCPDNENDHNAPRSHELNGHGGKVHMVPFPIPNAYTFADFKTAIIASEIALAKRVKTFLADCFGVSGIFCNFAGEIEAKCVAQLS